MSKNAIMQRTQEKWETWPKNYLKILHRAIEDYPDVKKSIWSEHYAFVKYEFRDLNKDGNGFQLIHDAIECLGKYQNTIEYIDLIGYLKEIQ